ncbi:MAG TPA: MerR family transcriptional regulator [Tissierellaceae bacterium]|nr:MerR family transcriptional regulator [Tissierellaceae bacterium]
MLDFNKEYSISEAAEITGYAPHVLRYYEKEFNMDIPRKNSNHRYYTYKEIELLQYIKDLKDKGFNNKQINLIINSPEELMSNESNNSLNVLNDNIDTSSIGIEISKVIEDRFFEKLSKYLSMRNEDTEDVIDSLKDEIIALRTEINSKERDVLICENAKLKMKIKEKTYENISLKNDVDKLKEKNQGFFKRLFKK